MTNNFKQKIYLKLLKTSFHCAGFSKIPGKYDHVAVFVIKILEM